MTGGQVISRTDVGDSDEADHGATFSLLDEIHPGVNVT